LVSRFKLPDLGIGVGFRVPHYRQIAEKRPQMDWFEVVSENFMVEGGAPLHWLDQLIANYPVVLHGVSMSLGGREPQGYLRKLARLVDRVNPPWVTDHVCFTGTDSLRVHDLLPVPYTESVLQHMADNIRRVQDALSKPFGVENPSSYLSWHATHMPEWVFMAELAERADCGILLDVNNIFVSSVNHGFDPREYIDHIPRDRVIQMHLAGHTVFPTHRLDTHDAPVAQEVWDLYRYAIRRFGPVSTLVEWDGDIPSFERLQEEAERARSERNAALAEPRTDVRSANEVGRPAVKLPSDWRQDMVDMIAEQRPPDDAMFAGGPGLTASEQLDVYREQYGLRIGDAVREEIPGLVALAGDSADDLIGRYIVERPSTSWTLNVVADRLPGWLEEQGVAAEWVEMARLDCAVSSGFEAANGVTPTPEDLATLPELELQPHVRLLALQHGVHHVRSAVLQGQEPPELEQGDYRVVVFRKDRAMRHLEVDPGAFAVLAALQQDTPLAEALMSAPGVSPEKVRKWFETFSRWPLVQLRSSPASSSARA